MIKIDSSNHIWKEREGEVGYIRGGKIYLKNATRSLAVVFDRHVEQMAAKVAWVEGNYLVWGRKRASLSTASRHVRGGKDLRDIDRAAIRILFAEAEEKEEAGAEEEEQAEEVA